MPALGLRPDGLSEWLDLRAHEITPRYVHELREIGVTDLDVDELTELRGPGSTSTQNISLENSKGGARLF
jgi:hypothetical protein